MKRIAVQGDLSPVSELLRERGYDVVPLTDEALGGADAVILTGESDDMLGDETIRTQVPVISAEGLTPEEVLRRIEGEPGGEPGRLS